MTYSYNTVSGTAGNDYLYGSDGDDLIYGLAGDDTLLPSHLKIRERVKR